MEDSELMTAQEVHQKLGISLQYIWKLARDRELEVVVIGRRRMFRRDTINNFIKDHTLPPKESTNAK